MRPLRIVVTGLAATYPYGGVFWDYLQYPLGLSRLGHEVLYLEDAHLWCYSPARRTFVPGGAENAAALGRRIAALDGALRWFFRDVTGRDYGLAWADVRSYCRRADLFLHVSMSCRMRPEYFAAAVVAFVDTDPVYTQAAVPGYLTGTLDAAGRERVDMLRRHDVFFTFAANIGGPDCRVPDGLFDWQPTRQPVVLSEFEPASVPVNRRPRKMTTVASWEPSLADPPLLDGVPCGGKSGEFLRFLDLPARSPLPLHLALSGDFPTECFTGSGFVLDDPDGVSADPLRYRDYLASSLGEWSVAKQAYVASRSGWFSCRSACYLALGVPVVVQDTGFGASVPTGEGVLAFADTEQAAEAIARVAAEPDRHAEAARRVARTHFEAGAVLTELLATALG